MSDTYTPVLTDEEIYRLDEDGAFIGNIKEIARAIEQAVLKLNEEGRKDSIKRLRCELNKLRRKEHKDYIPFSEGGQTNEMAYTDGWNTCIDHILVCFLENNK